MENQDFPILKYFVYDHLPPHLQAMSKPFSELAHKMAEAGTNPAEVAAGLRRLLEAKDCAVRSIV